MTPEVIAVMKMTMLKAGLSMAFMSSLVNIGSLTLQNAINRLGQDIIVAHTAARKYRRYSWSCLPCLDRQIIKYIDFPNDKRISLCYNLLKALYFCKRHHMTVLLQVHTTLKRADHFALFYKGHGSFRCFNYQSTAGKLKCRM